MDKKYTNLRMIALHKDNRYSLDMSIASGVVDFGISIEISKQDFEVICNDCVRAAFLHAALHHPFQLRETALNEAEQKKYLHIILHGKKLDVEQFLTELDHGKANGAISNMLRITEKREPSLLRQGDWFN